MHYSDFVDDSEWIAMQTIVEDWLANPLDHPRVRCRYGFVRIGAGEALKRTERLGTF